MARTGKFAQSPSRGFAQSPSRRIDAHTRDGSAPGIWPNDEAWRAPDTVTSRRRSARPGGGRVDVADDIYVSGNARDMAMVQHWVVRRLGTNGTFTTVDDYQLIAGKPAAPPTLPARAACTRPAPPTTLPASTGSSAG